MNLIKDLCAALIVYSTAWGLGQWGADHIDPFKAGWFAAAIAVCLRWQFVGILRFPTVSPPPPSGEGGK